MPYFSVLMTRVRTQSAWVAVKADRAALAHEKARDAVTENDWILDDDYFHGTVEDIQKINATEFRRLTQVVTPPATADDMKVLLKQAFDAWPAFDSDEEVDGGDLVEWFNGFRREIQKLLNLTPAVNTDGGEVMTTLGEEQSPCR